VLVVHSEAIEAEVNTSNKRVQRSATANS
jgi:hypothetical protein